MISKLNIKVKDIMYDIDICQFIFLTNLVKKFIFYIINEIT
jgi:hypothetical protein